MTTSPSSTSVSGIAVDLAEERELLKLPIRFGSIAEHLDDDGNKIPVIVGPDADADEIYVIARCDAKTGRYRDDVVMLGFSGPPLARAVFFAQAESSKEYRQLDTWQADAYADWLTKQPSDAPFDEAAAQ
jgi:hypothetical protein